MTKPNFHTLTVLSLLLTAFFARADLVTGPLTDTSQINPNQFPVLGAANMRFDSQAIGLAGSVNGVTFEDVIWGAATTLSGGVTLNGSLAGASRLANTASTISGAGEATLENVANTLNFYNEPTNGTLTFGNLTANLPVQVQLITSDASSNFGNWGGMNRLTVVDTVSSAVTELGTYQAGTEPNFLDAQLATFDAVVDANGNVQIGLDQTLGGQHFGVAGVTIYHAIPEPGSLSLLVLAASLLLGRKGRFVRLRATH